MKFCWKNARAIAFFVALNLSGLVAACQTLPSPSSSLSAMDAALQHPAYRMRPMKLRQKDGSYTPVRIWSNGDDRDPIADVFVIADGTDHSSALVGKETLVQQGTAYQSMRWATAGLRVIDFDFPDKVTEDERFVLATDVLRRTAEDTHRKVLLVGAGKGSNEVAQILMKVGHDVASAQLARVAGVLLIDPPGLEDLTLPIEMPLFVASGSAEQEAVAARAERAVVRFFDDESRGGGILLCRGNLFGVDGVNPVYLGSSADFLLNPSGFDGDGAQRPDPKQACRFVQHPLR